MMERKTLENGDIQFETKSGLILYVSLFFAHKLAIVAAIVTIPFLF